MTTIDFLNMHWDHIEWLIVLALLCWAARGKK